MKHDFLTCVLKHMVYGKRKMILQFWFGIIQYKIHSTKKIYNSLRRADLDVLEQYVEHDVPACVQWNIWPWLAGHDGCCLV